MSSVVVKENETLDSALRRFKRNCAKAGIQQEIRKREHYEKPSVRRKKKSEAARKRKYNQYQKSPNHFGDFFCIYMNKMNFGNRYETNTIRIVGTYDFIDTFLGLFSSVPGSKY